jgi:CubicO group peptidase (beta-lactamase class C family)
MEPTREPTRREMLQEAGAAGIGALAADLPGRAAERPRADAHLPHAKPEDIALDPRRLQSAYDLMDKWTTGADAPIPGAAVLVGRHGKVVAPRLFGRQGPERDAPPIRKDAQFLLASITKPVTYVGAMMLVERGLLSLTDPVTRDVPEFAAHDKGDVLVGHLFTHTSGLPDMLKNNEQLRREHAPLKKFLEGAVKDTSLSFRPGTQHSYQSMGTAVVAEIVQRLSGQSITDYLRQEIFEPLGLKSTALGAKGFPRDRLVRVQVPDYQANVNSDFGWNSEYWQQLGVPWGGLFSTPEDFAVLCQLMLSGGAWAGVRLLSPAAVRMMTTNRLDDLPDLPEPVRRTQPWGLGWRMNHPGTRESWGDLLGRHVYGHTGSTGTMAWIDPQAQGFCLLFTSALYEKHGWRLVHLSNALAAAFV